VPIASQLQNGGLNLYLPMDSGGAPDIEPSTAGNVIEIGDKPVERVRETVATYRQVRPYFEGDYYPLFEHTADETAWYGYQLHRPDEQRGMVVVFRRKQSLHAAASVALEAIDPKASYKLTDKDSGQIRSIKGHALRALMIKVEQAPGSRMLFYEKD